MDVPWASDFTAEAEFLLVPGENDEIWEAEEESIEPHKTAGINRLRWLSPR
jgi:hypothetical protein